LTPFFSPEPTSSGHLTNCSFFCHFRLGFTFSVSEGCLSAPASITCRIFMLLRNVPVAASEGPKRRPRRWEYQAAGAPRRDHTYPSPTGSGAGRAVPKRAGRRFCFEPPPKRANCPLLSPAAAPGLLGDGYDVCGSAENSHAELISRLGVAMNLCG